MKKIGFVGLGIMGKPMAKNLVKAGYSLIVNDIVKAPCEELRAIGAEVAATPAEAAANCDVVITMLPNSPQVLEVVGGKNGILEGAKAGQIYVDMSSIAPGAAQEVGKLCAAKGVHMLDCPVSGGEPKAVDGTLSIMCGGDQKDFDEVYDILMVMGASAVLIGGVGSGNTTKLANQIIVALNIAAMGEAMALAVKAGVDPEKVFDAIKGGLAGSTVLNAKMPMVLARNFQPGFRIDLHIKDLKNVMETAHAVDMPLPLAAQALEMFEALKVEGKDKLDHSALVQYYERLGNITIQ